MPAYRVVLVSPMHEGNVGAVARSMANFGFHELYMVDPCDLGDEAYKRAKHAGHILDDSKVVDSFEDALEGCSLVVGTSGKVTEGEKHFIRIPERRGRSPRRSGTTRDASRCCSDPRTSG